MRWLPFTVLTLALGCEGRMVGPWPLTPASTRPVPAEPPPSEPPFVPDEAHPVPPLPAVAQCSQGASSGHGYLGLAGESLEATRVDAAAATDVDRPYRVLWYQYERWYLTRDVQQAVGSTNNDNDPEAKDPGVGAAFGLPPNHWYAESEVGAFAVFTTFSYAFKVCRRAGDMPARANVAGWYEHVAFEPTRERATAYCQHVERSAWQREPNAAELESCVSLALSLTDEPDVGNRWAYVCASVIASTNFLSF